tara:strand:+ start:708 stop:1049 length:342 start_codon:yes stop_codon:yes gene_type:complete
MNKKYTLLCAVLAGLIVTGVSANAIIRSTCNYDPTTGYYTYDGQVYAHGTMNSAYQCALLGILPRIVSDSLGMYGDVLTKERALKIIETDKNTKQKALELIETNKINKEKVNE